jgi:glutathione synthase/RimK-type ligase-like ATP-grasp enzyme
MPDLKTVPMPGASETTGNMPAPREIALLTAANLVSDAPDRRADARLFDTQLDVLRRGLAPHHFTLTPVRWMDRAIDWTRYAAVLVNSAWDYQDNHEAFLTTLDRIADMGIPVFNDPATVRWNIRKTYLREMEAKGVPIIPTAWPEAPTAADITASMDAFGSDDVILKRQVGGGARAQVRYRRDTLPPAGPVLDRPGMIQPFIPAIATEGEYSFLFIDGDFSHALIKRPKSGDYRIQAAYGGVSQAIDPSPQDRAAAQRVLDVLATPPLYARVDMVRGAGGGLLLMELEVLEPYLFPEDGPQIGAMLGAALARRLAI